MNKSSTNKSSTLNRPLHILDIDNLLGDPTATDTHVINDCLGQYRAHTPVTKKAIMLWLVLDAMHSMSMPCNRVGPQFNTSVDLDPMAPISLSSSRH